MMVLLEIITGVLLAIWAYSTSYRPHWFFSYFSKEKIPGPVPIPVLGTRWIFSWFGRYQIDKIHDAYKDMNRRYGPLCKEESLWNYPIISVFSRNDIELLLRRGSKYPLRPPQEVISSYRLSRQDRYTNLGLVNEQGETWHKLREALTPELMGANTVLGFFPALNQVSDELIDLIKYHRTGRSTVHSFEDIAYKVGLESTCTLILGRHLGFLKPNSSSLTARLARAVRIHFTASRDAFYGLPLWKIISTKAYEQLIASEDEIYSIISELLDTTIKEQSENAHDEPVEAVFQSILKHKNLNIKDKRAAIVDFIAAGIHTLGNTLVFIFHLIGSNSAVQKELYEEVINLAPAGCNILAKDLNNAKYLRACIHESFRVIPTTPCIARILDEPIKLSGRNLEAGTVVLLQTWIAGLQDCNFKNAKEWIPERWLNPVGPHSPSLVTPFGFGRRICPGKRFVEKALQLIVAKVVREYEIVAEDKLQLSFEYILAPKGPISLSFKDRQNTL